MCELMHGPTTDHVTATDLRSPRPKGCTSVYSCHVFEFVRTSREPRPGPGCLHILPRVGQHVIALCLVDQIATRLRRLNQLLIIHHVQQVGGVDEGKTHHG